MTRLALLSLLALSACAPPALTRSSASPSWRADETEIRGRTRDSAEAWNRADLRGHLAMYADSTTYMTRTGPRPGVDAIEASFLRTFFAEGRPKQQLRFEDVSLRPLGRDAALETGRYVLSGGGEEERSGWFTLVWARTGDGWRVVHDHSS